MAVSNRDVLAVQRCCPQIYLACHTRHQRRRSNSAELTGHESALLAHLREDVPITPSALAAHLGIGRPAMSAEERAAALAGLELLAHAAGTLPKRDWGTT